VFAVGATSDFDYRANFSQYDSTLDFVAPGGGGSGAIVTTDRTGSAGYDSSDYNLRFSGTSASSPIAAGIAALVLSKNGNQSASTVATKLKSTCDKVGSVAYSGSPYTRNDYYGHGRLNADAAVNAVTTDTTAPTFLSATVMHYRAVDVVFSEPMGEGALTPGNYSITAGQGSLSSNPSKVIRIALLPAGFGVVNSVYRLIWNSGDMATSGTVTIAASSSIKDVAGNAVTGTLSRSSTGTKRLLAVNGGSTDASSTTYVYTPPFLSDSGWQGNEAAPFLTSSGSDLQTDSTVVSTSGITGPAPQDVYQSRRFTDDEAAAVTITYRLPNMPSSGNIVRLHFTDISSIEGLEVFHIYINDTYKGTYLTGDTSYQAYVYEYSSIGLNAEGMIEIDLVPQSSYYDSWYRASISGIEVMKP